MALIVTILFTFPLGYFLKSRTAAFIAYIAIHSFVFTFQTASLIIEWAGGDDAAFGDYPSASDSSVWGYAVVNLVIYAVGFGLVELGHRVAARRAARSGAVSLDPVS